ncbi:NLRC3 [Acrasis kona]|uniref:NLRC3 n=1 Tax=Acrasis kona TaxID=1008807 RepID=A0AAW2YVB4_9EUKA
MKRGCDHEGPIHIPSKKMKHSFGLDKIPPQIILYIIEFCDVSLNDCVQSFVHPSHFTQDKNQTTRNTHPINSPSHTQTEIQDRDESTQEYIIGSESLPKGSALEKASKTLDKETIASCLIYSLFGYFRQDKSRTPLLIFPSLTMNSSTFPCSALALPEQDFSPQSSGVCINTLCKEQATLVLSMISTTSSVFSHLNLSGLCAYNLCPGIIKGGSVGVKFLDLSDSEISDYVVPHFNKIWSLNQLTLKANDISDTGMSELLRNPNLRTLNVSHNNITDWGLKEVKNSKSLTSIDLSSNMINDEGLSYLSECKGLRKISIRHMCLQSESLFSLFRDSVNQIQTLNISCNSIDDQGAVILAQHGTWLIELDISYNDLSDRGLIALFKCPRLERLFVNNNNIYSGGLEPVVYNNVMKKLSLRQNKICDKGVVWLSMNNSLTWLDVSNNMISKYGTNLLQRDKFEYLNIGEN